MTSDTRSHVHALVDRRRFHEGKAWFAQRGGNGIPMEDVLADFGVKIEDFPLLP